MVSIFEIELDFAKNLVLEGGKKLKEHLNGSHEFKADDASHHSIHTEFDELVEELFREKIKANYPQDSILGEEKGFIQGKNNRTWVFDPLDSTVSYASNIPASYSVGIGLLIGGKQHIGAIYVPGTDELFFAEKNNGAHLTVNDKTFQIKVSQEKRIKKSMISFGIDMMHRGRYSETGVLSKLSEAARSMRMTTSGLLEMAYLAAGRTGAIYQHAQKPWDCLGHLLITEAGGKIVGFNDELPGLAEKPFETIPVGIEKSHRTSYLATANDELKIQLVNIISEYHKF